MKAPAKSLEKVAIIIPCYNEADGIAQVIAKFPRQELARNNFDLQIYVVDNNSGDGTAAVAEKAGAIVRHEANKGKGNALRAGFRSLPEDIDYVVMIDGDDTYNPVEVLRMLEPLRSNFCDVVVGSRLNGNILDTAMSKRNLLGNRVFTAAVRLLYGAKVTDVLTGYFAWKKPALDALAPHVTSPGFAIEMEMITKMRRLGLRLASVPISYHPRAGASNLHPFVDGFRILCMLLRNLTWKPRQSTSIPAVLSDNTTAADIGPRQIVFVSDAIYPYMKGGKEKRLHEITKRLAAMGHEVHIYTMHWWEDRDNVTREDGVYLHALCKRYDMYRGDRRTIKEGVMFGLACFKLLWAPFDVIDVDHMPFFPIVSAWIVCVLRRRKLYATWHEALSQKEWVNYMGTGGMLAALIERLCIRLPYRITAASAHTKELLATMHGRATRVELVASGIDTTLLRTVQPVAANIDVLYAGRLVKDKHVDILIQAVAVATQTVPNMQCFIIGKGPEKTRLEQLVRSSNLQTNITFLNPLPNAADLYAYMKAARVFCSPSIREGFGITSLEALGCGTPVITINDPKNAARHLVQDGQNGSVVPLKPSAIAEAILHWTNANKKPDIALGANDWDWHQLAKKQAEVYAL